MGSDRVKRPAANSKTGGGDPYQCDSFLVSYSPRHTDNIGVATRCQKHMQ
jgi:hypothetical protein